MKTHSSLNKLKDEAERIKVQFEASTKEPFFTKKFFNTICKAVDVLNKKSLLFTKTRALAESQHESVFASSRYQTFMTDLDKFINETSKSDWMRKAKAMLKVA